ncbi:hypothetical protein HMPREF1870_00643 [Bacteroidales bacterium KA00344]|nr:hypothetical protein HMPREF1870_00643 [Bacteroidales bacterium KA00344]
MRNVQSFNVLIENAMITNGGKEALTGHEGATLQYCGVAREVEKTYIMFENSGLKRDDRGVLYDNKRAVWVCTYLGMVTYGTVFLPIQRELTIKQINNFLILSESNLIFAGDEVSDTLAMVNESSISQKMNKHMCLMFANVNEVGVSVISTTAADLLSMTEQNRKGQNVRLSSVCKIIEIGCCDREFEETRKNQSNDIYIKTKHSYRTAC